MTEKKGKHGPLIHVNGNSWTLTRTRHARTTWARFKGLLGVSPREHDYALVFHLEKKGRISASIHMLFMQMPIDVLFLDENQKIVDFVENLKPWTLNFTPKKASRYVVELPAHALQGNPVKRDMVRVTWK